MKTSELIRAMRALEEMAEICAIIYRAQLEGDPDASGLWWRQLKYDHSAGTASLVRRCLAERGVTPPSPGAPQPTSPSAEVIDFSQWRRPKAS